MSTGRRSRAPSRELFLRVVVWSLAFQAITFAPVLVNAQDCACPEDHICGVGEDVDGCPLGECCESAYNGCSTPGTKPCGDFCVTLDRVCCAHLRPPNVVAYGFTCPANTTCPDDTSLGRCKLVGEAAQLCSNECPYARDGVCDDTDEGGGGVCERGTDCSDCGPRPRQEVAPTPTCAAGAVICGEKCIDASLQCCPAPVYGAASFGCPYGKSCGQEGACLTDSRNSSAGPGTPSPQGDEGSLCDDSCSSAFDGECDDGGLGAFYDVCAYGTDCYDCGLRPRRADSVSDDTQPVEEDPTTPPQCSMGRTSGAERSFGHWLAALMGILFAGFTRTRRRSER